MGWHCEAVPVIRRDGFRMSLRVKGWALVLCLLGKFDMFCLRGCVEFG